MSVEKECIDLLLHADAAKHPHVKSLIESVNNAQKQIHRMLTIQYDMLEEAEESGETPKQFSKLEASIEKAWQDCFLQMQEALKE